VYVHRQRGYHGDEAAAGDCLNWLGIYPSDFADETQFWIGYVSLQYPAINTANTNGLTAKLVQ
jgi:hypothetical protein